MFLLGETYSTIPSDYLKEKTNPHRSIILFFTPLQYQSLFYFLHPSVQWFESRPDLESNEEHIKSFPHFIPFFVFSYRLLILPICGFSFLIQKVHGLFSFLQGPLRYHPNISIHRHMLPPLLPSLLLWNWNFRSLHTFLLELG